LHVSQNLKELVATLVEVIATISAKATLIPWDAAIFGLDSELSNQ